jgi:hypothetical protein
LVVALANSAVAPDDDPHHHTCSVRVPAGGSSPVNGSREMSLSCALFSQFLANHTAQSLLESAAAILNERPEGLVDHRLVISAASFVCLASKPSNQIFVQSNCDSFFPRIRRND